MARLILYVDTFNRAFVTGPTNPAPFTPPSFIQGDTVSLQIYLLQRSTNWPSSFPNAPAYTVINNSDLSLKLGLGSKASTGTGDLVASQFTWDRDENSQYFYADLALNTSEINSALTGVASTTKWLEIEVTQSALPTTVIQQEIAIHADVIKNAAVTVQPGQTALSAEVANATYLKKFGDAGDTLTLVSENGLWARILGVDNNGNRIDSIEQL